MKITLKEDVEVKKPQEQPSDKIKVKTTYHVCFDSNKLKDGHLIMCDTLEEALLYANKYNQNEQLVNEYGRVHVEIQVLTREVIEVF